MHAVLIAWLLLTVGPQGTAGPEVLQQWIGHLGSFDHETRSEAARQLRRAPVEAAARALEAAAAQHQDEYVRFRAFVLLTGLDEAAAGKLAARLVADRNDRVRTAVYQWLEHHPNPDLLPRVLTALPTETSEFVRPALTRAVAAHGQDRRAQEALRPLVLKGEDLFRGAVIGALGDHGGTYAVEELLAVARIDGPLQDDAITALAGLRDPRLTDLLRTIQVSAPRELQPTISASLCLLGVDCAARLEFLSTTLRFAARNEGYQPLLRGAAHALAMLAAAGNLEALEVLVQNAQAAPDPLRAPIALAVGSAALRRPSAFLGKLRPGIAPLGELLRDAFDMLSEDLEEERFGVLLRRALWASPEGSAERGAAAELTRILEF